MSRADSKMQEYKYPTRKGRGDYYRSMSFDDLMIEFENKPIEMIAQLQTVLSRMLNVSSVCFRMQWGNDNVWPPMRFTIEATRIAYEGDNISAQIEVPLHELSNTKGKGSDFLETIIDVLRKKLDAEQQAREVMRSNREDMIR